MITYKIRRKVFFNKYYFYLVWRFLVYLVTGKLNSYRLRSFIRNCIGCYYHQSYFLPKTEHVTVPEKAGLYEFAEDVYANESVLVIFGLHFIVYKFTNYPIFGEI